MAVGMLHAQNVVDGLSLSPDELLQSWKSERSDSMKKRSIQKQSIQYDSPLDALVAIAKRLSRYETEAGLSSEDFFDRFSQGSWGDDTQSVEWANDYRHYLALRAELGKILDAAA